MEVTNQPTNQPTNGTDFTAASWNDCLNFSELFHMIDLINLLESFNLFDLIHLINLLESYVFD